MGDEEHGVELVDGITTRIDAALSGYEGQHAGDDWYDESDPLRPTGDADLAMMATLGEILEAMQAMLGVPLFNEREPHPEGCPRAEQAGVNHGPWCDEPDEMDGGVFGYEWIARRNCMGNWTGYLIVPEGHPWHGDEDPHVNIFGRECDFFGYHEAHRTSEWLVGFHCGHAGDISPMIPDLGHGTYCDIEYVVRQLNGLCGMAWGVALASELESAIEGFM